MKKQIKIATAEIKFNDVFDSFFEKQNFSMELQENIRIHGVLIPPVIDINNILIDGYERVKACNINGIESIWVLKDDKEGTLEDRLNLNLQRSKTEKDLVKEFEYKINQIKKIQGRKKDGQKKTYAQQISELLNGRWKDEETINKIIEVNKNDFENKILTRSILNGRTNPNAANTFLNLKKYDKEFDLGYSEKVESGELQPHEANKLIKNNQVFKEEKNGRQIIPEKCYAYEMDCTTIGNLVEFHKKVALIFTSPPYYKLKKYKLGEKRQAWNHGTPEEYCEYIADLVKEWIITLKDSGSLMININDIIQDGLPLRIPDMLINAILRKTKLKFYQTLIWSKKNCMSTGASEQKRPKNNIEYILWFVLDPKQVLYKPIEYNKFNTGVQNLRGFGHENVVGKKFKKKLHVTSGYSTIWTHITDQDTDDVIVASVGTNHKIFDIVKTSHPAVMSGYLPVCPILMTTHEGDLVYDPMSGTNIVGYISQILNRRSLSTELSPVYFKDGCENLQNAINKFNPDGLKIINQIAFGIENNNLNTAA